MMQPFSVMQLPGDIATLKLSAVFSTSDLRAVFDHFIKPDLLLRWWPPVAVTDPQPGGKYQLTWPKQNWELVGDYTIFEPPRHLAFTWFWTHEPHLPTRTVDIVLEPAASGCQLLLTHGTYTNTAVDQEDRQSHLDGWNYFLERLNSALVQGTL
jgi:uncharacterized protein YndB with AHSA1/START domain